jgi:PPPDE putative peptidase domain/PUL domain
MGLEKFAFVPRSSACAGSPRCQHEQPGRCFSVVTPALDVSIANVYTSKLCLLQRVPTYTMAEITLHVYDLSQGMARQFSPMLLGKTIDLIPHTGIVAFGAEYYFGGGIASDPPRCTPYGSPIDVVKLGLTTKSLDDFRAFLTTISPQFTVATYNLLDHNCNNFSDTCAKFLLGDHVSIPHYILDLPREAMDSPMGPMLRPMLEQMGAQIRDQSVGHEVALGTSASGSTSQPSISAGAAPTAVTAAVLEPCVLARANKAAILAKLSEFDSGFDSNNSSVQQLLDSEGRLPAGKAFPALDMLRVAAAESSEHCAEVATAAPRLLAKYVLESEASRPERMMALRIAVNSYAFESGAVALSCGSSQDSITTVVEAAAESMAHENHVIVKTAAALALNIAGAPRRHRGRVPPLLESHIVRLAFAAVERAGADDAERTPETDFSLLATIAVLVNGDADARELVRTLDLNLTRFIDPEAHADERTRNIAIELDTMLNQN